MKLLDSSLSTEWKLLVGFPVQARREQPLPSPPRPLACPANDVRISRQEEGGNKAEPGDRGWSPQDQAGALPLLQKARVATPLVLAEDYPSPLAPEDKKPIESKNGQIDYLLRGLGQHAHAKV